ncbi:hypothetical protein, partial [Prosthecobacter sp.]|uniref:hypothetical protein n=1 Tax=Prosthecobacter sp. TaxID=1965333 RepID=UPI001D65DABD
NGGLYLEGRRWAGRFAELAEEWEMHVDLLDGAYYYVKEGRLAAVSKALHAHFENDPQIESAYVKSTAWCGSYTFEAGLRLQGSPKDPELQERARKIAEGLKKRLPSFIGGFKITRVRYEWPQTGTSGNLPLGFLWKRDGDDFRVMNIGNDFHDPQNAARETRWSQTSWNEGRSVEE